ncbi:AMP-dependent synthetase/ligase [Actinoallomurus rhizosphaericola]|uniref:AMP-dependent synthetase/ligase n=1 Tax=Actinoallomurus rhizosphaericola TaxID=2952536 RepID=UPI002092502F|nr:long-chain fatty acid--CoA ligase [Actinoallomurus rhizosphaericola]MCO5996514.1 long-chain fatty acid--CoA ligase [Actinoallomurus rhizosphaericola]
MREYSVPAQVTIADSANLTDTIFSRAAEEPDRVVIRRKSGSGWRDVTAREFADAVGEVARGLVAAGIEPGDRVALMSRTRYEWTVADYAIWAAGGITVPIYETSSASQIEWIVGDSGAKGVFVETDEHAKAVETVRDRLPELANVWRMDDLPSGAGSDEDLTERRESRAAADLATIIYTSGTTGRPKGCEITHSNLLATARNVTEGALTEVFGLKSGSTLLFLPLAHVFARLIQVGCVEAGVTLGHTADMAHIVDDLASFEPTFLLAVPRVFEKVYIGAEQKANADGKGRIFRVAADTAIAYSRAGSPGLGLRLKHALFDKLVYGKLRAAIGGRVTHAVSGGAALGERLGHFFDGVGITILEGYGLTETTAPAAVNLPSENRIGTVGKPIPGTTVRIGDDGEVLVKGPNVFAGYWHNEEATKGALDEGWFHTGDVGELDEGGYLRITGRKKEIIVTAGGKNVAPAPLEDRLRAHPLISQCMVVGDARKFIGCLITLDPEALEPWKEEHGKTGLSTAELVKDPDLVKEIDAAVADANTTVSRAEAIKKYRILEVDFTEESGHLTPTLKVKRNLVEKDFADEIEALYA